MRLAVIGDVGGHLQQLEEALIVLGVDVESRTLPEDLVVCQVGDLVHRGPDSLGTLLLVNDFMQHSPNQWVQLAGNHEAQYLFPPRFKWPEVLDPDGVELLLSWWESGQMRLAAAFETSGVEVRRPGGIREVVGAGPLLVTHAGLTAGLWRRLGSPQSARSAMETINSQRFEESSPVWNSGAMLDSLSMSAGVVWAEAAREVYESWRQSGEAPSFNQAHGHSSAMWWSRMRWTHHAEQWKKDSDSGILLSVDPQAKILRAEVKGRALWGVDPGHGISPTNIWSPLVLDMPDPV